MTHTISFVILDDLRPTYGPMYINIDNFSIENIVKAVTEIVSVFKPNGDKSEQYDPTAYYFEHFFENEQENIRKISYNLMSEHYYVRNRFEKYYVVAFAVDYSRFEVFSKDCDKELIAWDDNEGPILENGLITNPDYNENPVVTMMKFFNNHY